MGYFGDSVNRLLGKRQRSWHRVMDAFHLKYSEVNIDPHHLDNPEVGPYPSVQEVMRLGAVAEVDRHPPGGFLVWRMGNDGPFIGTRAPLPIGSYVLQLYVSVQAASQFMDQYRRGPDQIAYARKAAELTGDHAITFCGIFSYDAAAGELCSTSSFAGMVIAEDRIPFLNMAGTSGWQR